MQNDKDIYTARMRGIKSIDRPRGINTLTDRDRYTYRVIGTNTGTKTNTQTHRLSRYRNSNRQKPV